MRYNQESSNQKESWLGREGVVSASKVASYHFSRAALNNHQVIPE